MSLDNLDFGRYIEPESHTRWADIEEIKKEGYLKKIDIEADESCKTSGIPIISDGRTAYVDTSDIHTIIFGSTGSKKTRLFGMPMINLLAMGGESFIATDPKGELFEKTSGFVKSKGYNVKVLNFRNLKQSDFWNPLALPHELHHQGHTDDAAELLNDLVETLLAPQLALTKDRYWIDMGGCQFLANLLFFIDTATREEANFYNFTKFFNENGTADQTQVLANNVAEGSIASINFKAVLSNAPAEKTFANVTSTVIPMLKPFIMRKELCQVLSKSSFDINTITSEKTAIYIIVPDEKTTLHFLVTMFIKQTYEALISQAQLQKNKRLPIRMNFVLDEFANIPVIPDMPNMISAGRSRNIRFFLMVQGMEQLYQKYKRDANTIKGNCDNWIFLSSREYKLLKEISDLCGEVTKRVGGTNYKDPLISITELQKLKKGWKYCEALIKYSRLDPYVSVLPDIDEYKFKPCTPIKRRDKKLPELERYNLRRVIRNIRLRKRPIPFSKDVFGVDEYYPE